MPRKENQKQKLFRLLEMFIRRTDYSHGITMKEILDGLLEYGISAERKSIYDDFLTLEELGYPVEKLATKPPSYTLSQRPFELPELKLLVDAVGASKFISEKRSRELIEKLKGFASIFGAGELQRQVHVEGRTKTSNNATIYITDCIHTALNNNLKIKFKYYKYNSRKQKIIRNQGNFFTVSPLTLIWQSEFYYLVALDDYDGKVKHFRVDKMEQVKTLDIPRDKRASSQKIDPTDYSQKIFAMYSGVDTLVTLECREELANVIIDRFGTDISLIPGDGTFRVTVRVMVSQTFYGWLCELGSRARVIGPESVVDGYLAHIKSVMTAYEGE